MLDQRRRCLADVVQMLYKCFVFAGLIGFVNMIVEIRFCDTKVITLYFRLTYFVDYLRLIVIDSTGDE